MEESPVLRITTPEEIGKLRLYRLQDKESGALTKEEFLHLLRLTRGYGQYPGEPRKEVSHILLYNGGHTGSFIRLVNLLAWANVAKILAYQAFCKIRERYQGKVHWVVGPAESAIPLLTFLAEFFEARFWFVKKGAGGRVSEWDRFTIEHEEVVLAASDLMTTPNGSLYETKESVRRSNREQPVKFLNIACVLVNRSRESRLADDAEVISSFDFSELKDYSPEVCPFCKTGSELIKQPKNDREWERFLVNWD